MRRSRVGAGGGSSTRKISPSTRGAWRWSGSRFGGWRPWLLPVRINFASVPHPSPPFLSEPSPPISSAVTTLPRRSATRTRSWRWVCSGHYSSLVASSTDTTPTSSVVNRTLPHARLSVLPACVFLGGRSCDKRVSHPPPLFFLLTRSGTEAEATSTAGRNRPAPYRRKSVDAYLSSEEER